LNSYNIERNLLDKSIKFKAQEYDDDISIVKIEDKVNLIEYKNKQNSFPVDEDLFFYLDQQSIPYAFLLINTSTDKYFFMNYPKKKNWLSQSFERSNKSVIYFGKIVLQNQINKSAIIKKIEALCQ